MFRITRNCLGWASQRPGIVVHCSLFGPMDSLFFLKNSLIPSLQFPVFSLIAGNLGGETSSCQTCNTAKHIRRETTWLNKNRAFSTVKKTVSA